ncbi:Stf0 family sulfotransferase [Sphingomonas sp. LB-2]|uniref:Stf0 family sulfotransferase n=1 Tax=Sphingomonas caeni TaxID=2984949 RepID=UPI0022321307|nr:Stf0 family sulfotransferase [Sphingomonas caeni]MCW3846152.1 Stf0 family sulfotransferase [Sphingomonas caeni]
MLDFETGYEGKFDFPGNCGSPSTFYLFATVPRTGSSWFSHLLWATGCLGAPLEYLNFDAAGPYGFAHGVPELQAQTWRSVLRRRTSPNGVFGFKAFPLQLEVLQAENPGLMQAVMSAVMARPRIVYLERRDRVAHAISLARAAMSGVWRQEQETGDNIRPDFSPEMLAEAERRIDAERTAWEEMFRDLRIEPLRLWYEDIVANPPAAMTRVARFLDVKIDRAAAIEVPAVRKQSEAGALEWAKKYAEVKGAG